MLPNPIHTLRPNVLHFLLPLIAVWVFFRYYLNGVQKLSGALEVETRR